MFFYRDPQGRPTCAIGRWARTLQAWARARAHAPATVLSAQQSHPSAQRTRPCARDCTHDRRDRDFVATNLSGSQKKKNDPLYFGCHNYNRIECFTNTDWAGSKEDRRFTSSYCVFVDGNLISWKSKKQGVVSRSSAESEYRALAQSVCEIMWLHQLLMEVGIETPVPAKLWCDNQASLHIASNPMFHERTKHIEIKCHFVREKI